MKGGWLPLLLLAPAALVGFSATAKPASSAEITDTALTLPGLAIVFEAGGVRLVPKGAPELATTVSLSAVGCSGSMSSPKVVEPNTSGAVVSFYRSESLTEWYQLDPRGLEQGFSLQKPLCTRAGAGARLELQFKGGLYPAERATGIRLETARGVAVLDYGELQAWDARGRALSATTTLDRQSLVLEVDDREAVYPIMIDPLIAVEGEKILSGDPAANDAFGASVALSGTTLLVGLEKDTSAGVYVFQQTGGAWSLQQKLLSPSAVNQYYGYAVALQGDTAVVGAKWNNEIAIASGAVYFYQRSGTVWTLSQKLQPSDAVAVEFFGTALSLNADTLAVGAPGDTGSTGLGQGSVYVYVRQGTSWVFQQKLFANDAAKNAAFGSSVWLEGDRLATATATSGSYAAYLFKRVGAVWTQEKSLAGSSPVTSAPQRKPVVLQGDRIWLGDPNNMPGVVYLFDCSGSSCVEQQTLHPPGLSTLFGIALAVEGDHLVVGAQGGTSGACYLFQRNSNDLWSQSQEIVPSDALSDDRFGAAVSLSAGVLMLGAKGVDAGASNAGAVYQYTLAGVPCANATLCGNGLCVDGFCCDSVCQEACRSCGLTTQEGICSPVTQGSDADTCVGEWSCSALGNCGLPEAHDCSIHTDCFSLHCVDARCCDSACAEPCAVCSVQAGGAKDGACSVAKAGSLSDGSCKGMVCDGSNPTCPPSCASDEGCESSHYCSASGTCAARKQKGETCSTVAGEECLVADCRLCDTAGGCVDGRCCDSLCAAACTACSTKAGSSQDGTCTVVPAGTLSRVDCSHVLCNGVEADCASACTRDDDCEKDYYCAVGGVCLPRLGQGVACDLTAGKSCLQAGCRQCKSGFCTDGFCCENACKGQCEVCNIPGSEGLCLPVEGAPRGGRAPCSTAASADPCSARTCQGALGSQTCEGFVESSVSCAPRSCRDGILSLESRCNGSGVCPSQATQSCDRYSCKGNDCGSAPCLSDSDCAPAHHCDPSTGECVSSEVSVCDGDHTLTQGGGKTIDCSPFRCSPEGVCLPFCATAADCVAGSRCDSKQQCVPEGDLRPGDTGCSCRTAPRSGAVGFCVWVLSAIGLAWARRLRRAHSLRVLR